MKNAKLIIIPLFLCGGFLLLTHFTMGLRAEHFAIACLILILTWAHSKTRRLMLTLLPFALFGALYDYLRLIPQDHAGTIQVFNPYFIEFLFFAFPVNGVWILPNDFFRNHHHIILDIYFAIIYSLHIIIPIAFAFYLWLKNDPARYHFGWILLIANIFAFLTYVFYPAAPPWYVELYGMRPGDFSIPGSAAALLRVDQFLGIPYFAGIYGHEAWIFGALPSMHAGIPTLTLLYALRLRLTKISLAALLFLLSVWGAAIYLRHHYIIDLLLGAAYGLVTFFVFEICPASFISKRTKTLEKLRT